MVNVPFSAMYTAKQEIAEITLFSLFTTTGNAIVLFYMVTHPGEWLVKYALCVCLISVVVGIGIAVRALLKYRECRVCVTYWFEYRRIISLGRFSLAKFLANFSAMFAQQGNAVLVNKFMGPIYNASMTIGTSVATHTATLSSALNGALSPAVTNLYGEGRIEDMRRLCFRGCRIVSLLVLLFAIPVSLEVDELLHLWLGSPPDFAAQICLTMLYCTLFDRMTGGYWMAIYAKGYRVVHYSWTVGWAGILGVLAAAVLFVAGLGMWSVVIGKAIECIYLLVVRFVRGKALVGFEFTYWLRHVFVPIVILSVPVFFAGASVSVFMQPSFWRVVVTTSVCMVVFVPIAWFCVFDATERLYVRKRIRKVCCNG